MKYSSKEYRRESSRNIPQKEHRRESSRNIFQKEHRRQSLIRIYILEMKTYYHRIEVRSVKRFVFDSEQ